MKKVFLSLLLTVGVASVGFAQGVKLGIKAGPSVARYVGDGTKYLETTLGGKAKMLVGFHGGVTLNAPLGSDGFLSFQPELLYSQRGHRLQVDNDRAIIRHHFIDLPLLARINADGFIFEAGPQLGYLIGTRSILNSNGTSGINTYGRGDNQFSIGYIAGVGYQLASGPTVGVRYNGSISGVYRNIVEENKTRHSVFQLYFGYVFGDN